MSRQTNTESQSASCEAQGLLEGGLSPVVGLRAVDAPRSLAGTYDGQAWSISAEALKLAARSCYAANDGVLSQRAVQAKGKVLSSSREACRLAEAQLERSYGVWGLDLTPGSDSNLSTRRPRCLDKNGMVLPTRLAFSVGCSTKCPEC